MRRPFCDFCGERVEERDEWPSVRDPTRGGKLFIKVSVLRQAGRSLDVCRACRRQFVEQCYPLPPA